MEMSKYFRFLNLKNDLGRVVRVLKLKIGFERVTRVLKSKIGFERVVARPNQNTCSKKFFARKPTPT